LIDRFPLPEEEVTNVDVLVSGRSSPSLKIRKRLALHMRLFKVEFRLISKKFYVKNIFKFLTYSKTAPTALFCRFSASLEARAETIVLALQLFRAF
jgi:hypothetical protein